jgi:hypothetical protein
LLLLQARKYLIAHSTEIITTPRAMMARQKKQETSFPTRKISTGTREKEKKTDTQIQTPTKWR